MFGLASSVFITIRSRDRSRLVILPVTADMERDWDDRVLATSGF